MTVILCRRDTIDGSAHTVIEDKRDVTWIVGAASAMLYRCR